MYYFMLYKLRLNGSTQGFICMYQAFGELA